MKRFPAIISLCCLLWSHSALAEHQTDLRGIVNVPGMQGAILEIDHGFWLAHTGDHFKDRIRGAQIQIEVLEVDLTNEIVKTRIDGEEHTNSLSGSSRLATARSWLHLQNADFSFVLQLYSKFSSRVILLHPAVNRASFSYTAIWTNQVPNQTETAGCFAKWFNQRDASAIADGESFLQIMPTAMTQTASLRAKDLPVETGKQNGLIDFEGVPTSQLIDTYGRLLGRRSTGNETVTGTIPYFRTTRPLSKAEVMYALETLLAWNNIKITLNKDGTFTVVKIL